MESYECPRCGERPVSPSPRCESCGARLRGTGPGNARILFGALAFTVFAAGVSAWWFSAARGGLPRTMEIDGAAVEIVGHGWTSTGDRLFVRAEACPWSRDALAAYRMVKRDAQDICLTPVDGGVREATPDGGSQPIATERFEWAVGWPRPPL